MSKPGRLPEPISSRLLLAAALMDAVFVLFLTRVIGPTIVDQLTRLFSTTPPEALWLGVFALFLVIYAIVSDVVLGGASLGRILLGLKMRDTAGQPVKAGRRTLRAIKKYALMGLGGIRLDSAASYDKSTGIAWFSEMAPRGYRHPKTWNIIAVGPKNQKTKYTLGNIARFASKGMVHVGRDPGWADIVLPRDAISVSGRHCMLRYHKGELYLRDGDENAKASSNGTAINAKRLPSGKWIPLRGIQAFNAANVTITLDRLD